LPSVLHSLELNTAYIVLFCVVMPNSLETTQCHILETHILNAHSLNNLKSSYCHVFWGVTIRRGMDSILDLLHLHTQHVITSNTALPLISTLYSSLLQTLVSSSLLDSPLSVSWQRIVTQEL
jgi:hypothetical protein